MQVFVNLYMRISQLLLRRFLSFLRIRGVEVLTKSLIPGLFLYVLWFVFGECRLLGPFCCEKLHLVVVFAKFFA